jgi:hypothetical protein
MKKLYWPIPHAGYVVLLLMLGMSGDLKPTWKGLLVCLLFDAGRFTYHQIKFRLLEIEE